MVLILSYNDIVQGFCFRPGTACNGVLQAIENETFVPRENLGYAYILDTSDPRNQDVYNGLFDDDYKFMFFSVGLVDSLIARAESENLLDKFSDGILYDATKRIFQNTKLKIEEQVERCENESEDGNTANCKHCYMLVYRAGKLINVYTTGKPIEIWKYLCQFVR